jgi:putative FmdB family regulatory protein
MPLYDYKCISCDQQFEDIRQMHERFWSRCPRCNSLGLRLPSAPNFALKGKGFHVNDYPKGPKR